MATEPDKTDSGALGTILAVLTFGVLFSALGITALVRAASNDARDDRALLNEEFSELRGAQEADLNLPASYVDEKAGVVRLPIDRAMQVVVKDLQNNPWSATAEKPEEEAEEAEEDAEEAAAGETGEGDAAEGEANGDPGDEEKEDDTDVKAPEAPKPPKAPAKPKPAPAAPAPQPPAPAPRAPTPQPKPAPAAPAQAPAAP
jgi:hypothetical protein